MKTKFVDTVTKEDTKQSCIKKVIQAVMDAGAKLLVTREARKKLEDKYKKIYLKCKTLNDFLRGNPQIQEIVDKVPSIKNYLAQQIEGKDDKGNHSPKALQSGIIAECIAVKTLANALRLKDFIDTTDQFAKIPEMIAEKVRIWQKKADTTCGARWIYYDKKNPNIMIFQYGSPSLIGDAAIVFFEEEVIIEIKDVPSTFAEYDLIYDENGKLIIDDVIKTKYSYYVPVIENFNREDSIFDTKSNSKIDDGGNPDFTAKILKQIFTEENPFDVIMFSTSDELVLIRKSDLCKTIDGKSIITTRGSEIRRTGKNGRKNIFTPDYLNRILDEIDAKVVDGTIFVPIENVLGEVKGRGQGNISRLKINHLFYIKVPEYKKGDKYYKFERQCLYQSKSGIAMHLDLQFSADEIYRQLYK